MTRTDLANPTTEETSTPTADLACVIAGLEKRLESLTAAVENLTTAAASGAYLELKCFKPSEVAALLGKTENWVIEAISDGRIPRTYIGRSPRLTAEHIREIQAADAVKPSRFTRKPKPAASKAKTSPKALTAAA